MLLELLEFVEKLGVLVPPPRFNLVTNEGSGHDSYTADIRYVIAHSGMT